MPASGFGHRATGRRRFPTISFLKYAITFSMGQTYERPYAGLEEIARQAEAIVPCTLCRNNHVSAGDEDAERRAYAMATNAWKRGESRSAPLDEVQHLMNLCFAKQSIAARHVDNAERE